VSHGSDDTVLFSGDMSAARLGPTRRILNEWATARGLEADVVDAIVLSGYEALANTVEHAYREHGGGPVELRARLTGELVTIVVRDHGQWRAPATEPTQGGRGLVLIRRLGTDTDVCHTPDGTIVRMTWRLPFT
jgi:serine/threonine-protein kinase RsbW